MQRRGRGEATSGGRASERGALSHCFFGQNSETDTDRESPSRARPAVPHAIPFHWRLYCCSRYLIDSRRCSTCDYARRDRSRPRERGLATCPPRFLFFAIIARMKRADPAVESPSSHFSRVLLGARRLTLDALSLRGVVARDLYGPQFREIAVDVGLTTVGHSCSSLPFTRSS